MFHPEEVIFAPTGQCNLRCAHCRVSRPAARLGAKDAIALLDSIVDAAAPIDRVGFSGGEPFLEPDFICEVSAAALERGLFFDRLMTNGVWFRDDAQLASILDRVAASGFDGQIGLSVDSWHDQDEGKLLAFIAAAFEAFGRRDCVDILSVRAPDEGPAMAKLSAIARRFDGKLLPGTGEPEAIRDTRYDSRRAQGEEIPEALSIEVFRFPYSPAADEGAWEAASWFVDDFCEGPGNVLYVHPDGRIAACCGFANENEELIIGNIGQDGYASVMAKAAANPHIAACYERGLGAERERLEAAGFAFPGKASDMCFFCDWICRNRPKC